MISIKAPGDASGAHGSFSTEKTLAQPLAQKEGQHSFRIVQHTFKRSAILIFYMGSLMLLSEPA